MKTDCAMSPVGFYVEGPTGEEAYEQAGAIAYDINAFLRKKGVIK